MTIDPRLGLVLMLACIVVFVLVERDRQRRIATLRPKDDREDGSAADDS